MPSKEQLCQCSWSQPPFLKLDSFYEIFMRFLTCKQLHINDHRKAHFGVQILPKDFRHRRPSVWRDSNPRSRGWESSTLTTWPSAPALVDLGQYGQCSQLLLQLWYSLLLYSWTCWDRYRLRWHTSIIFLKFPTSALTHEDQGPAFGSTCCAYYRNVHVKYKRLIHTDYRHFTSLQ